MQLLPEGHRKVSLSWCPCFIRHLFFHLLHYRVTIQGCAQENVTTGISKVKTIILFLLYLEMLPVYRAISFIDVYEKRNRTKPWLISVNAGGEIKPFVVKLFDTHSIETHDSVLKEVLGNVLARKFDLPVPNAALIDMGGEFASTLRAMNRIEALENADWRLKFGTEEQKGVLPFDSTLPRSIARQIVEIDTVLGFDCLIRNIDRNRGNPNLLVRSNEAFLIDHELAFQIDLRSSDEVLNQWFLQDRFFKEHVFFDYLKHSHRAARQEYFDTFEEYLRTLNINMLNPYFEQLAGAGFSPKNHILIREYMEKMKGNSSIFAQILKGLINGRPIHI